jgi:hypothetical protein
VHITKTLNIDSLDKAKKIVLIYTEGLKAEHSETDLKQKKQLPIGLKVQRQKDCTSYPCILTIMNRIEILLC